MSITHKHNTRAGLIPYYIDEGDIVHVAVMVPSDPEFGGEEPQFAKGHIEEGESEAACAVREGVEELGIYLEDMGDVWKVISVNKIAWFAVEMSSKRMQPPSHESEYAFWLTVSAARERIRPWQQQILSEFWFNLTKYQPHLLSDFEE
jgi:8-oxo-dGTP pyrophosphatase MutT (NUDIX family)